jgi:hypothetical protein
MDRLTDTEPSELIEGQNLKLIVYSHDELLHENFIDNHLKWWALQTQSEVHMCTETVESLQKGLLAAIIALVHGEPVAAAGIFHARTKHHERIMFEGQPVVELGSNFVTPLYRVHGLGKKLIEKRIEISLSHNWFPVSVTTNPVVQRIFEQMGMIPMDSDEMYGYLQAHLCICLAESKSCRLCPHVKKGGWVLKPQS